MEASASIDDLVNLLLRVIYRYGEMDKIPYDTGVGGLLHTSEVHAMDFIGYNENINITRLAKLLGLTKGAVSVMIRKLVKKGFVNKKISPETENEVVLSLTPKGREVFEWHQQHRCRLRQKLEQLLKELPEDAMICYTRLGIEMEKVVDEITEERTALKNNKP